MGTFCAADGVTRLDIKVNTPVVGFLVAPGRGYPHNVNRASAPIESADLYQLVSLPIFGTYDEVGGLKVDESQLSVQLALMQTATGSWTELQDKVIHAHSETFQLCGDPDEEGRNYGIFIVQRQVYEKLMSMNFYDDLMRAEPLGVRRKQDVDAVLAAFAQHMKLIATPPPFTDAQQKQLFQTVNVTALAGSYWTDDEGVEHELPRLAQTREARVGFGPDLWTVLRKMNLVSRALLPDVQLREIQEMLEQFWDASRFLRALNIFNIIITPTLRSGRGSPEATFELSLLCMQNAWEQWETWLTDYVDNAAEVLRPRVAEVKELASRMESLLSTLE